MGVKKIQETSAPSGSSGFGGVIRVDDSGMLTVGDLLDALDTDQLRRLKLRIDSVIRMRGDIE